MAARRWLYLGFRLYLLYLGFMPSCLACFAIAGLTHPANSRSLPMALPRLLRGLLHGVTLLGGWSRFFRDISCPVCAGSSTRAGGKGLQVELVRAGLQPSDQLVEATEVVEKPLLLRLSLPEASTSTGVMSRCARTGLRPILNCCDTWDAL